MNLLLRWNFLPLAKQSAIRCLSNLFSTLSIMFSTLSYIYTTLSKTNCTGIKYTKYKVEQQVSLHQKDERDEGTISARGGFYLPYRIPTPSCSGSK